MAGRAPLVVVAVVLVVVVAAGTGIHRRQVHVTAPVLPLFSRQKFLLKARS
jgi:hypothetical protein